MSPVASIVITTRNRCSELEDAVASAVGQKHPGGIEVIVIDDGSTDGTSERIAAHFPQVKLVRYEVAQGYIVQRNRGARLASAPVIFSIDDDALFSTDRIVADVLAEFQAPHLGAVAIPFINVRQGETVFQKAPGDTGEFVVSAYIGTAHAVRRDLFLQLGGYREALFHQGEEGDYCLRMLEAGYVVRLGRSDPIHHFESPRRDFRRVDIYGRRNNILFGWYHAPTYLLPSYLAATSWNGMRHGIRVGRLGTMLEGLGIGYRALWQEWRQRKPVPSAVFRLYRELAHRPATAYLEIADRVPARTGDVTAFRGLDAVDRAAGPLSVSVMIATKNRLHELRRTCRELQRLDPAPLEILITADGCTDGTIDFIRSEMPSGRLFINQEGRGSIVSRDHMIRAAHGDLVLSLDDDSYPRETDCLATITALFAQRQKMAVLHFPQCTDEYPETLPSFDFGSARATRTYSSSGAVLRRATYLQLPGFEPAFFHAYEEPDYALQCIAAGHEVLYDPSVSIRHHYTSAARNERRTHHRHARNEFWSTLLRCPFPLLFLVAPYRALTQLRYAFTRGLGWVIREPVWWMQALAGIPRNLARRRPVSWADYCRWLMMTEIAYPPLPPRTPSIKTKAATKPSTA